MARILSDEEKKLLLSKLSSGVVATRFSALKFITTSIVRDSIDFAAMEGQDTVFTTSLLEQVKLLKETDGQNLIRKEADNCLDNLKMKLRSAGGGTQPKCEKCGEMLSVAYKHCPKCGVDVTGQKWLKEHDKCPKCGLRINEKWNHCVACGTLLKKEEEAKIRNCPFCGKDVQPEWALCPFCGSKLKLKTPGSV